MALCTFCKKSSDLPLVPPTRNMLKVLKLLKKHYKGEPICQKCYDTTKKSMAKVAKIHRQQNTSSSSSSSSSSDHTSHHTTHPESVSEIVSREEIHTSTQVNLGSQVPPVHSSVSQDYNSNTGSQVTYTGVRVTLPIVIRETPPAIENASSDSIIASDPHVFTPPEVPVIVAPQVPPQANGQIVEEEEVLESIVMEEVVEEEYQEAPSPGSSTGMGAPMPARPRIRQSHHSSPEEIHEGAQEVRGRALDANAMRRNNGG